MILLASDVMDESAAVYLNDAAKARWPYTILLPYLKSAIGVLQAELESNDLPPLHEIASIITVEPGAREITLPDDFVFPMYLDERAVGEHRFEQMEEVSWEPDAEPETKLKTWVFREGRIQILGATTERQVKLRYLRSLNAITAANSVIEIPNAKQFLAAETAALASNFGGSATARGNAAGGRAEYFKRLLISALTKRLQDRPVRRRGYRWR
jgi:hypothetical protein